MHNLLRDLRMAMRALGRAPGFTAASILTLALGVGTSTAIFTLVDGSLVRALPFPAAREIFLVDGVAGPERDLRSASFAEARDWEARNRSFSQLSLYDRTGVAAAWGSEAEQLRTEIVSASYFDLLGARPARGRLFLPGEDRILDRDAVAVISHELWQRRFGGGRDVIGRPLTLNGRRFAVVGVMPAGFRGIAFDAEVWIPAAMASVVRPVSVLEDRKNRWLSAVGRLRPGTDQLAAQADMDRVARQLAGEHPATNHDRGALLRPLREVILGNTAVLLETLFGGALLLLVVACANVTSLQLVRATGRQRQVAVFRALGASPTRVVRHQLGEGLLLALAGGAGGVLVAHAMLALLLERVPTGVLPLYATARVDARALLFAVASAGCCAALFAVLPALRGVRGDVAYQLRQGSRTAAGGLGDLRRPRGQQLLVISEIALSLVLLVGAGLLGRTMVRLAAVEPGFAPARRLAFSLDLPVSQDSQELRAATAAKLRDALAAIPGVQAVALGSDLPLRGSSSAGFLFLSGGATPEGVRFYRHRVLPDYLAALEVPVLRGRGFSAADRSGAPAVAIASRSMAQRFWGEAKAVGQRISLEGPEGPWVEVVGVAGDVRYRDLTSDLAAPASEPDLYLPFAQQTDDDVEVALVSSASDAAALAPLARAAVASVDPQMPIFQVETLEEVLANQMAIQRLGTVLLAAFAAVALALAAIGIYGVIAYAVALGGREIALRMALGGRPSSVVALVVRQGMVLVAVGVVAGVATSAVASRALSQLLFGVAATDFATFALVTLFLLAIALAASLLPAWRASRLEPQAVLRGD